MPDKNNLYTVLDAASLALKTNPDIGLIPSAQKLLDTLEAINTSIVEVDSLIKNHLPTVSDEEERTKQRTELIKYKSELLTIKSLIESIYNDLKLGIESTKHIVNITEKVMQVSRGDVF